MKCSPATIRNECAILENKNLIKKLHSSSGRVPSTQGYRYYVDNLITNGNIDPLKSRIEKIFESRNLNIDEILEKTSDIISEMTNLTALVIKNNSSEIKLKRIELFPTENNNKALVIIVLSNGHIENKIFDTSKISLKDLKDSIDIFNKRLEDTKINEILEKFDLMYPLLKKQVKKCELFLKEFITTLTNIPKIKKTTHGIQYMLQNPEFNNSDTIKNAIKLIESFSSFEYFKKISSNNQDRNNIQNRGSIVVRIGDEFENTDFNDISIISTNYDIKSEDEKNSRLALVGPKRIDYNKVLTLLEWVSDKLVTYSKERRE